MERTNQRRLFETSRREPAVIINKGFKMKNMKTFTLMVAMIISISLTSLVDAAQTIVRIDIDDSSKTIESNEGEGAGHIGEDNHTIIVYLDSQYDFTSELHSNAPGIIWEKITEFSWKLVGVDRNQDHWAMFKCTMKMGGSGTEPVLRWGSISDIDYDGDTDHNGLRASRFAPSGSDAEDKKEYTDTLNAYAMGVIIPVNDDNDVTWDRRDSWAELDLANDDDDIVENHLTVHARQSGDWTVNFPSTNTYDENGVNIWDSGFDGHLDYNEDLTTKVLYIENKSQYGTGTILTANEARYTTDDIGVAIDKFNAIFLGVDIDGDSDSSGGIEAINGFSGGEDFYEAHDSSELTIGALKPYRNGLLVPLNNAEFGIDKFPIAKLKPLGLNTSYHALLTASNPEIKIKKISGSGAVRLHSTSLGDIYLGSLSSDGDSLTHFDGTSIWDLLKGNAHFNLSLEGDYYGEVILAIQFSLNGELIHEDRLRICVVGVVVDLNNTPDDDDDIVPKYSTSPAGRPEINARIKVVGANEEVTAFIQNGLFGGTFRFPLITDLSKTFTLPSNGDWVDFSVSGQYYSTTMNDASVVASVNGVPAYKEDGTVYWVDMSYKYTNADETSPNNDKRTNWYNLTELGDHYLGLMKKYPSGVGWGVEYKGTVYPSDFELETGNSLILTRDGESESFLDLVDGSTDDHDGSLEGETFSGTFPGNDPSSTFFRDDFLSGDTIREIYDIDGYGLNASAIEAEGMIQRRRVNFKEYAFFTDGVVDGNGIHTNAVRCSNDLEHYIRVTWIQMGPGVDGNWEPMLNTHTHWKTGDNEAGSGTTNLTWDLQ